MANLLLIVFECFFCSGGEKSNQVSIAGHVEGVEAARKAIRRLLPLVLAFDFQVGVAARGIVVPTVDANHPLILRIQQVGIVPMHGLNFMHFSTDLLMKLSP